METSTHSDYLGEEKISKLLIKFSIPCVLSLLISALYNIVDQIFIGNSSLGYLGNAATSVVFPVTVLSLAFAWCFGDGAASYLSICQGKKDMSSADKCVGGTLTVTLTVGLIFSLICALFMNPILYAFGASAASIGLAQAYFKIILAATPIFMLMNTMSSMIRADGSPGFSLAVMLVGAVINIILDPIFIFVFHWGIEGAAYATIIGQIASFLLAFVYFFRSKTFTLTKKSFIPDYQIILTTIKYGASTFITQLSIVVVTLISNTMLVKYGAMSEFGTDIPIAVIGIAMKVFTIIINIVVGIVLGGQPILGYNYGAKKFDRVKETYRIVFFCTVVVGVLSTILFQFFPQPIINLFGKQNGLYNEFALMTFRIFLSLVLFTCVIKASSIFFQAVGQPVKSAIISLVRDILCFVPLVVILPMSMGIKGVLVAAPLADAIGFLITVYFIFSFFKMLNQEIAQLEETKH